MAEFGFSGSECTDVGAGRDQGGVRFSVERVHLEDHASIELPSIGVTVVVGANNTGKSTFLRQINDALQSNATSANYKAPRIVNSLETKRDWTNSSLFQWLHETHKYVQQREEEGGNHFVGVGGNGESHYIYAEFPNDDELGAVNDYYVQTLYQSLVFYADAQSRFSQGFFANGRTEINEPPHNVLHVFQDKPHLFGELDAISWRVFQRRLVLDDFPGGSVKIRVGSVDGVAPPRGAPLGEYGDALLRLPPLDEQGDGMRSFFGLMVPLVAGSSRIAIVDEPEAFLHPPQARALGRELGNVSLASSSQVIVASHDKDFITGLLHSEAPLTIARLSRTEGGKAEITQLSSAKLKEVWDDRVLRYSNVLDGLFSSMVVLCEAEQDCKFYEAALNEFISSTESGTDSSLPPASEIQFVPTHGKGGILNLQNALNELSVPTVAVVDLDLLRSADQTRTLYESRGGEWSEVERDFRVATNGLSRPKSAKTNASVLASVQGVLRQAIEENDSSIYNGVTKEAVDEALKIQSSDWATAKRVGTVFFTGEAQSALIRIMERFDAVGLVLVQVGELEGFAREFSKGKGWLAEALGSDAHKSREARDIASRVLQTR